MSEISKEELAFISEAHAFLENESIVMKLTNYVARPMDWAQKKLTDKQRITLHNIVEKSLLVALKGAVKSLDSKKSGHDNWEESLKQTKFNRYLHNAATGVTGAVGGFFGEVGLIVELPFTTTLMLRNIASIAQEMGFDPQDPNFLFECLYVFSLGSKNKNDDHMDSGYYASRVALNAAIAQSAEFIAVNSARVVLENLEKKTAPVIISLIGKIAARFEIVVTEKLIAEMLPVIGSMGGASLNVLFTNYFGQAAKYHFGMKALEKKYGEKEMSDLYSGIPLRIKASA